MWDIFQRSDSSRLSEWLSQHAAAFSHMGHSLTPAAATVVQAYGPVSSQAYMLNAAHRQALEAEAGDSPPQHYWGVQRWGLQKAGGEGHM